MIVSKLCNGELYFHLGKYHYHDDLKISINIFITNLILKSDYCK